MRVSLTADPVEEVKVAWEILRVLGLRHKGPVMIACPSCGRTNVDVLDLAERVEERLERLRRGVRGGRDGLRGERPRRGGRRRLRDRRRPRCRVHLRPRRGAAQGDRRRALVDELFGEIDAWIAGGMVRPQRKTRKLSLPVVQGGGSRLARRAGVAAAAERVEARDACRDTTSSSESPNRIQSIHEALVDLRLCAPMAVSFGFMARIIGSARAARLAAHRDRGIRQWRVRVRRAAPDTPPGASMRTREPAPSPPLGRLATPCPSPRRTSTSTSTASTRSSTGRAGSARSWPGRPSWGCPRSASPTTARWPARWSSRGRRPRPGSSRSWAARCTWSTTTPAGVQKERRAHLTLLAETTAGYHNLVRLVSAAYLDGYWYRPARRPRPARRARRRHHRPLGLPVRARLQGARRGRRGARAQRARHARRASSAATRSTSSCRTAASTSRRASTRAWPPWPATPACRWSARATSTT